jgi:putative GTP pyrophosphokinase
MTPGAEARTDLVDPSAGTDLITTFEMFRDLDEREHTQRFLLHYQFGMREVETKLSILRDEFRLIHDYNPIEHIASRLKSLDSLTAKMKRKGVPADPAIIRERVTDIAGIRVICSFVDDTYRMFELLTRQDDITLRTVKDYIAAPKANGYRSLHAIIDVPVFLSAGTVSIPVEVQFRTTAMDFWASLEHKLHYKYGGHVPPSMVDELRDSADTAAELDARMGTLRRQIHGNPSIGI